GQYSSAPYVRPLDTPLQTVCLVRLTDHEGVQFAPAGVRRVQHRGGHRVRTQRQPADRVELQVRDVVQHDRADQRCGSSVQGHPAQIDVVVGLLPGGQGHLPTYDRFVVDLSQELITFVHDQ